MEVEHLLQVVAIKALSRRANVERVEAGPKGIVLAFRDNVFANPDGLIAFIREQGSGVRMRNDPKNAKGQQLVFFDDWPRPQDRLKGTAAVLRKLASIAEQQAQGGLMRHSQHRLDGPAGADFRRSAVYFRKRVKRDHAFRRRSGRP